MALARLSLLKSDAFLGISDTNSDNVLKALLAAATAAASSFTSRALESASYTDQLHQGTGTAYLWTREWPVSTLTAVKIWDGTAYTAESSTYYELLDSRYIHYPKLTQQDNASYSAFPCGRDTVALTYTAGYVVTNWDTEAITTDFSDSGGVPQDLEYAIAALAAYQYRRKGSTGIQSESYGPASVSYADQGDISRTGIPNEIKAMLLPYIRR